MVKNPPVMLETWVQSLSWEDPLEEGMATPSSILAWRIPMDRGVLNEFLFYKWVDPKTIYHQNTWLKILYGICS